MIHVGPALVNLILNLILGVSGEREAGEWGAQGLHLAVPQILKVGGVGMPIDR